MGLFKDLVDSGTLKIEEIPEITAKATPAFDKTIEKQSPVQLITAYKIHYIDTSREVLFNVLDPKLNYKGKEHVITIQPTYDKSLCGIALETFYESNCKWLGNKLLQFIQDDAPIDTVIALYDDFTDRCKKVLKLAISYINEVDAENGNLNVCFTAIKIASAPPIETTEVPSENVFPQIPTV